MKGYIAIISVLIILSVVLVVALGAGFMSIGEADMGLKIDQDSESYYLASACAEEALQRIHDSISFQGSGNLSFSNGSCSYTVILGSGESRTINASGALNNIIRRIKITISQITPAINISLWQEVANF